LCRRFIQLDAIQRSQKLMEARLQDLHQECKMNELSRNGDAKHFRMILTEMQKALGNVVSSMVSTQDGIRTMATVLTEVCNAVNTNAGNDHPPAASTSATGKLINVEDYHLGNPEEWVGALAVATRKKTMV